MANALKKIQARVKKLRKRYPKKKYSSLMKQAGKEYKAGKLKPRKKSAPKRKKPVRRKAVHRKKPVARKKAVRRRKATKPRVLRRKTVVVYRSKKRKSRRRVSGIGAVGNKIMKVLPLVALGVGAYLLLKPKAAPAAIVQTTNPVRNQTASDVLLYAQAAGMTAAAIAKLIDAINSSNDSQVQKIYDNVKSGQDPYANIAGIGSRPVLTRSMQ